MIYQALASIFPFAVWIFAYFIYKPPRIIGSGLLITAHPDDECMFFTPTIIHLKPHILCLSIGNADGIGKIREKEFLNSCKMLGIDKSRTRLINDIRCPDSMSVMWDKQVILDIVLEYQNQMNFDYLITFDNQGISGHANHRSIYHALKHGKETGLLDIPVYTLKTVNVFQKFATFLEASISSMLGKGLIFFLDPFDALKGVNAMFEHPSQLVWFRYLYLAFSRYMIINELQEI